MVEYSLTYTGFKEDIVVSQYTGQTEYPFRLLTNGLALEEINGSFFLVDELGNIRASIGDIIIFTADERNNAFGDIEAVTVRENQEYVLNIVVDADYLADPATVYPIRIDPTVKINYNNGAGAVEDITVSTNTVFSGTYGYLFVGRRQTEGIARILLRFPGLDLSELEGATITDAHVRIRDVMCEDDPLDVSCHIFTGAEWEESTSTTWANCSPDSYVSTPLSTVTLKWSIGDTLSNKHWYQFDVTEAVQGWVDGNYSQSKGFLFKVANSIENGDEIQNRTFGSYNRTNYRPNLTVTYTLADSTVNIREGESAALSTAGINGTVVWSSNNTGVATISTSGLVTGVKAGYTTVTASVDGNVEKTFHVYVTIADGVYYIKNLNSNYYLSVEDGNIENATDVVQLLKFPSIVVDAMLIRQMWKISYLGEGRYSVRPMNKLDMGLDVSGYNVDLYNIGESDTLANIPAYGQWTIEWYSTGYIFKSKGKDTSIMQVEDAATDLGATVIIYSDKSTLSCRWELSRIDSPPTGVYWYDTLNKTTVTNFHFGDGRYITYNNPQKTENIGIVAIAYSPLSIDQSFTWTVGNADFVVINRNTGVMTGNNSGQTIVCAQKSIGGVLYTLTADIISIGLDQYNAGVRIATVDGKQYYDYTIPANQLFANAVILCEDHRCMNWTQYCSWAYDISILYQPSLSEHTGMQLGSFLWFYGQVNHNAVWDIKREVRWNEAMPGVPYLRDSNDNFLEFVFRGEVTTAENLGNIMYGYTGRATGFGEITLYWGGGVAAQGSVSSDQVTIPPYYGDAPKRSLEHKKRL